MDKPRQIRRVFSAEFKHETVRRFIERRAQGVAVRQIALELDIRPEMLRAWQRTLASRSAVPLPEVFPGHGRMSSEQDEWRRLQRELQRVQQENTFLQSAAAYFARESRCATSTPRSRHIGSAFRCG